MSNPKDGPIYVGWDLADGVDTSVTARYHQDGTIEVVDVSLRIDPNHPSVIEHKALPEHPTLKGE